MRVVKEREGGIVRRVLLLDDDGDEIRIVNRFLSHLTDADTARTPSAPTPTTCATSPVPRRARAGPGTTSGRRPRWSSSATCGGCRPGGRRSGSA